MVRKRGRLLLGSLVLAGASAAVIPEVAAAAGTSSLPHARLVATISGSSAKVANPEFLGAVVDAIGNFVVTYVAGKAVDYVTANSPALLAATEVTLAGLAATTATAHGVSSGDAQFNASS